MPKARSLSRVPGRSHPWARGAQGRAGTVSTVRLGLRNSTRCRLARLGHPDLSSVGAPMHPMGEGYEISPAPRAALPRPRLSRRRIVSIDGDDAARLAALADLAERAGLPLVATNDVHYHVPSGGRCRTCSPASASTARIDEAGVPPARQRRAAPEAARGDGAAVRATTRGARAHASRSPSAAASRSTSCATSIPRSCAATARRRRSSWRALTWEGAARALSRAACRTRCAS